MARQLILLVLVVLWSCSGDGLAPETDTGPGDGDGAWGAGYSTRCGSNLRPYGPACVPVFDDCESQPGYQIPTPGGGCKRVGVEPCADGTGLKSPPDWTCQHIGPPKKCLKGWDMTVRGWCEPILPKQACGPGMMERIGETQCQPVGNCGTGSWGSIKIDSSTLFVDQAYAGGDADGSQQKPFPTIGQAVKVASIGARIAVAAGQYQENVKLPRKVALEGRCPKLVRIVGQSQKQGAVVILADGVEVRGVTVTGPGLGLAVRARAVVEGVVAEKCPGSGVQVFKGGELDLCDSLVADNGYLGLSVSASVATVERTVVRGTVPSGGIYGRGIAVSSDDQTTAKVTLRDSVVSNNSGGIAAYSAAVTLGGSVVRDNASPAFPGINVWKGELAVEDSVVSSNQPGGIFLKDADAAIERSLVLDALPLAGSQSQVGQGIRAHCVEAPAPGLSVRESVVAGNTTHGVALNGYRGIIERTRLLDTRPHPSPKIRSSAAYAYTSTLEIRDCLVSDNDRGIQVYGSFASVDRTMVKGSLRGGISAGVLVTSESQNVDYPSMVSVRDSLVTDSIYSGIDAQSSDLRIERTVVRATTHTADGSGWGIGSTPHLWDKPAVRYRLVVQESLLEQNSMAAITISGAEARVVRSVVRDTRPTVLGWSGIGIRLGYMGWKVGIDNVVMPEKTSRLELIDSLLERNHSMGLGVWGGEEVRVERSVVRDTLAQASDGRDGLGMMFTSIGKGTEFNKYGKMLKDAVTRATVQDSLVSGSRTAGILVGPAQVTVTRSVVQDTLPEQAEGRWGDGIQVTGPRVADGEGWLVWPAGQEAELYLSDSVVERCRVGVLFSEARATGWVRRSVCRENLVPLLLDRGADPDVEDNLFIDNQDDREQFGEQLGAAPVPKLPLPPAAPQ